MSKTPLLGGGGGGTNWYVPALAGEGGGTYSSLILKIYLLL